jgi:cysteinyl-tRNA synthetase
VHGLVRRLDETAAEGPEGPEGPAAEACAGAMKAFDGALADDLNTPEALAAVHGLVGRANALLAEGQLTRGGAGAVRRTLGQMDEVFGVLLPVDDDRLSPEEQALFDERQEARRERDFARADQAREKLLEIGVILEDTPKGTRWRRTS